MMKRNRDHRGKLAAVLALALVFSVSVAGVAGAAPGGGDPAVTLREENGAAVFSFNRADGNLFDDFAGVMPGDQLKQTVTFQADGGNRNKYEVFLYARVCDKGGEAGHETDAMRKEGFLDYLDLSVTQAGKDLGGASVGAGTGADGVPLGVFTAGQSAELEVALTVDIEMGNDFQGAREYLDWVFFARQVEDPPPPVTTPPVTEPPGDDDDDDDDPPQSVVVVTPRPPTGAAVPPPAQIAPPEVDIGENPIPVGDAPPTEIEIVDEGVPLGDMPQTGDESRLVLWAALAALSGAGMLLLLIPAARKRQREE